MNKLILLFTILIANSIQILGSGLGIIPLPNNIQEMEGSFIFNVKTKWIVENKEQQLISKQLTDRFFSVSTWDYRIDIDKKSKTNSVLFRTNLELPNEAYKLNVTKKLIIIEASSSNGFFNAVQTLRQLLPPQINSGVFIQNVKWSVPCVKIIDSPRFRYRGFMLDVSRYFMPKKDVLRLIDFLAYHKINYFHWHLTDDNGWRIEIKKYPRLTDIGAWRVDRSQNFPMRRNAEFGEAATQGGFYTQDDIREVVKYARSGLWRLYPR